jgi:integrase
MGKQASGNVFESRGKLYARTALGGGKRHCAHLDMPRAEADTRSEVLASIARDVRATKDAAAIEMLPKLLDRAATADSEKLKQVLELVGRLVGGRVVPAKSTPVQLVTFKSLGDRWVSGELARDFPDYIKKKRSAGSDKNLLTKWIYPLVQDVPLSRFTLDHAEQVMRALPPALAPATRRHVALAMSRVLKMAVFPLRIITLFPLPSGFLPKAGDGKKQEMLYTDEHDRYLAHTATPFLSRLLAGFLAREGMRHDEAESLTWADIDLERGIVRIDENKTDDPRSWAMRNGTAAALAHWYALRQRPKPGTLVFSRDGRTKLRARPDDYRAELLAAGITRPELHHGTKVTKPTAFHACRALFVTEALAFDKSEAWVIARTGHKSSQMVAEYRRKARTFTEAKLPPLGRLDACLGVEPYRDPIQDPPASPQKPKKKKKASFMLVGRQGLEPWARGLKVPCSTN